MSHTLLEAMLPKSSLVTNWRLPDAHAIQRPSAEGLQECDSASRANARLGPPFTGRVKTESRSEYTTDCPSGNQSASSQAPGGRCTSTRGTPPNAGVISTPRSEPNTNR